MADSPLLTRRRVLGGLIVTGGIVATGAGGLALQGTVRRAARGPLLALDPTSFSILAAVADRMCPGTATVPTPWELEVPERIDAFLATTDPAVPAELMQGLAVLENALPGLLLDGRWGTFTSLDARGQDAALMAFATSRIALRRTVYKALLGLVSATYWAHPDAIRYAGYRPLEFSP